MSNLLEFAIRLRDSMSPMMARVAANTNSAMAQAAASVQRMQGTVNRAGSQLGSNLSDINRRLDSLRQTRELSVDLRQIREANRSIQALERSRERLEGLGTRRRMGGGIGGRLMGLGAGIGITAGLGSMVNAGMQAQQQRASFEVMAGQQKGGKLFSDVTKFAQDSIFGKELYQNAQTMKAFGMQTESVMPTLKMLGDVSMGNKDKLSSLTLAYSQVMATGRLMGQDLNQLINAGFNPLQIMSQQTGKSMGELKAMMEKGQISFAAVQQAFMSATSAGGQFYGMTEKIAATDFGKLEAMKGQVDGLAISFGGALAPIIGDLITNYLSPLATWTGENQKLVMQLGAAVLITGAAYKVGAIGIGIYSTVSQFLKRETVQLTLAQWGLNKAFWANPITWVVGGLIALGAGLVLAYKHSESFRNLVHTLGAAVGTVLRPMWELVKLLWEKLQPLFESVGRVIGSVMGPALNMLSNLIGGAVDMFMRFVGAVRDNAVFKWLSDKIGGFVNGALTLLINTLNSAADLMDRVFGNPAMDAMAKGIGQAGMLPLYRANYMNLPKVKPDGNGGGGGYDFGGGAGAGAMGKSDGINGGGVRSITINLGKFFDNINIYAQDVKEGADQAADHVLESLNRVLYSGGAMQTD